MTSMNEVKEPRVPVIHSTNDHGHAVCLSDRFGDWIRPEEPGFEKIAERFPDPATAMPLVAGDPRAYQLTDNCFVAVRNNQLGILVEHEINAVLAESTDENAELAEYGEADYQALVSKYQAALAHLPGKWASSAEVFLADGPWCFDSCLTVCAFVPLQGDMEQGFTTPFGAGSRRLVQLLADLEAAVDSVAKGSELSTDDAPAKALEGPWWAGQPAGQETPTSLTVRMDDLSRLVTFVKNWLPEVDAWPSDREALTAIVRRVEAAISEVSAPTQRAGNDSPAP